MTWWRRLWLWLLGRCSSCSAGHLTISLLVGDDVRQTIRIRCGFCRGSAGAPRFRRARHQRALLVDAVSARHVDPVYDDPGDAA